MSALISFPCNCGIEKGSMPQFGTADQPSFHQCSQLALWGTGTSLHNTKRLSNMSDDIYGRRRGKRKLGGDDGDGRLMHV